MSFGPSYDPYSKYGMISERSEDPYDKYRMISERSEDPYDKYRTVEVSNEVPVEFSEEIDRKAKELLDFFIGSMSGGDSVAQMFPLSQEDFREIVGARIDARGPSIQERLERLGATSFKDAIRKGIMPPPPRLPGV